MARLIVTEFISLDGVIEDPGGRVAKTKLRLVGTEAVGPDGILVLPYEPVGTRRP
jgi:hypothetical protein